MTSHFTFVSPQWAKIFYAPKAYLLSLPFHYALSKDWKLIDGQRKEVVSGIGRVISTTFLNEWSFKPNPHYWMECFSDRDLGQWGADRVCEALRGCGYDVAPVGTKEIQTQGVDLIACRGRKIFNVEVKTDERIAETGNIFLEIYRPVRKEEKLCQ